MTGAPVGEAAQALWDGAFGSDKQIGATVAETVILTVLALGWCIAFTGMRINVGLEGQAILGGIAAAVVGLHLGLGLGLHLVAVLVAGVAAGAAWAGIAAWLWARRGVNEIISTLMLNLVAIQLLAWVVRGPLKDDSSSYPQSSPLPDDARWPTLVAGTPLTWAVVLLPIAVIAVAFALGRTTFGFRLRVTGHNEHAAHAMGISPRSVGALALLASGGLAGIAGATIVVGGQSTVMAENFTAGRGFEAIAVALLARNRPLACIPAALLFAVLQEGGGLMEARVGVPSSIVLICQGLVITLVAGAAFVVDRRKSRSAAAADGAPAPTSPLAPVEA